MGAGCSTQNSAIVNTNGQLQRVRAFKVVLIGDPEVGKSSIFRRYVKNQFKSEYEPTHKVSIGNVVKKVNLPGDTVIAVTLWDLPSDDDMDLRETYFRDTDAAIVVVDMNDTRSIELANSWKQEFANKVTRTRKVTEILPDGTQISRIGLLPCDSSRIPVLLLGNKYDLIEENLQREKLKQLLNEPLSNGGNERESNQSNCIQNSKAQCVTLLEHEASEHCFAGSIMVSAKDDNFSVHSAIQAFIRLLLDNPSLRGKKRFLEAEDKDEGKKDEKAPQNRILTQTGIIELDEIFDVCTGPIKRSRDYKTYYELVLKKFKQTCADMGYLREPKASIEDCIIGMRDALKSDTQLGLKVKDFDGFVCLIHGKEEDEDYKMNRQLKKTLDIFNHEFGGICKAITRDCPMMNGTLAELDARLTTACDAATEETSDTGHAARNKIHIVSVCERNRAMIRFTQEQNETCVSTVRIIHKKVNMALLW